MPEPLAAIRDRLIANPAPVLLLDTCALLDIARAFTLRYNQAEVVRASSALAVASASNPRGVWLVLAERADAEFRQVLPNEATSVQKQLETHLASMKVLATVIEALGADVPAVNVDAQRTSETLRDRAESLAKACVILERMTNHELRREGGWPLLGARQRGAGTTTVIARSSKATSRWRARFVVADSMEASGLFRQTRTTSDDLTPRSRTTA